MRQSEELVSVAQSSKSFKKLKAPMMDDSSMTVPNSSRYK